MTKNIKSIIQYNPDAFLDYIKNKHMNQLIDNINTGINNININNHDECMLCNKLKQRLGKNKLGKVLKYCKK
jgi:hypothetical protein